LNQIKITQIDSGHIIENDNGRLELSWADFCGIARYTDERDARNEIDEYLSNYDDESAEKSFGMARKKIADDKALMDRIIARLIRIRINNETTDNIHEAIVSECGQGG